MECQSCLKPNAQYQCGACKDAVCKKCVETLEPNDFHYMNSRPDILSHQRYCGVCFSEHVEPARQQYEETLEAAKKVFVYFKTKRKGIPIIAKAPLSEKIIECPDRHETILRLAYISAAKGMNGLVEVEALQKKVRNHAYQSSVWSGVGTPAMLDASRIYDEDLMEERYR